MKVAGLKKLFKLGGKRKQITRARGLKGKVKKVGRSKKRTGKRKRFKRGEFSIISWKGYPKKGPKPKGPFRLLSGKEYERARAAANKENKAIHKANPSLKGKQIHEIHPVKFGGSATDKLIK